MRKKWLLAVLGGLVVAGGAAYVKRDALAMALISRAADGAMSRNVMAELPADALHVGFCGTGSPLPNRDRAAACTVVIAGGRLLFSTWVKAPAKRCLSWACRSIRLKACG